MDTPIRLAAFEWLKEQSQIYDDVLPRGLLENGFNFQGNQIFLVGASGIWKPKIMEYPISITTTTNSLYSDPPSSDFKFLQYSYRGTDPNHRDNVGLRKMMDKQIPLIYFFSVFKGKYLAVFPVFIVGNDEKALKFKVSLDDMSILNKHTSRMNYDLVQDGEDSEIRRAYLTSTIMVRIHQKAFRERILRAYNNQCSLCRLKHRELLDAAHIIPDMHEEGFPVVQNGLSLCKIHHAAFDKNILGINPDYVIKLRKDILTETDGPMLKYGIQSLENQKIVLPSKSKEWPDQDKLEQRFNLFLKAG